MAGPCVLPGRGTWLRLGANKDGAAVLIASRKKSLFGSQTDIPAALIANQIAASSDLGATDRPFDA